MTYFLRGICLVLLLVIAGVPGRGQSPAGPHYLSLKREIVYGGMGVGVIGLGQYLHSRIEPFSLADLNPRAINRFDRVATDLSSGSADRWSDYTLFASVGLSGALLLGEPSRRDFMKISLMFTETMAITYGLTLISKSSFQRPRPYVFDEQWDAERILSSNDRAAFVSGHTSMSAAGAFFFARTFSDYYPDSRLKPYVWGVSAGLPALTAYLRIRAGKHYPSDVIAGYVLGAAIGYWVPKLHKKLIGKKQRSSPRAW